MGYLLLLNLIFGLICKQYSYIYMYILYNSIAVPRLVSCGYVLDVVRRNKVKTSGNCSSFHSNPQTTSRTTIISYWFWGYPTCFDSLSFQQTNLTCCHKVFLTMLWISSRMGNSSLCYCPSCPYILKKFENLSTVIDYLSLWIKHSKLIF